MKNAIGSSLVLSALLISLSISGTAKAETFNVAVAANFLKPATQIASLYEKSTGHKTVISAGASGKLYAQIANGAPFHVFLSADRAMVEKLMGAGLGEKSTAFPYALGRLALYSSTPGFVDGAGDVLKKGNFAHIAMADSKLAPYGVAARQVMERLGVMERLKPKIVTGESIGQTYQFVSSGAAQLGFVAMSQLKESWPPAGSYWLIPHDMHDPIEQWAVLTSGGKGSPAAKGFLEFVRGPEGRKIIGNFGYGLP
ncbi:MAG: molybdate ABC transporter substrate-binding protein [Nitrospinae bacterium]|nr:molybdate ABC transporter substrate-binding protein [Nitrospinota bacterium]